MPAPCCLRWAGALPRPPECSPPKGWCPVTRRSLGVLLKCLTCVLVIMLTVPPVLGNECASRNRVPLDGASRALLAPQVVEAVLEKVTTGFPVYETLFRVTRVYKKYRGPRRLKKRRTVSLPFRRPAEGGSTAFDDCLVAADLMVRRKYFLFLSSAEDRREPLRNVFPPLPSTKRAKKRIKSIVCAGCAKAPSVSRLRDDSVVRGHSANLTCTFDGTPAPAITWMKDGKAINASRSRNIRIHTRRVRIRPRPRRPRRRRRRRDSRRRSNDNDGSNIQRRRKSRRRKTSRGRSRPMRVISTLAFRTSRDSDAGIYSCVGKSVLGEASARAGFSVVPPLDPGNVSPCPYDSYCLNGGTCMFFKHFGEFVCQCAEGYKGQRCQEKEVFPTFRDHNCRGSLPNLSPSRGLRCPRNQPVFLWEILQKSLAARKHKVSTWTKTHQLPWSPPHASAGLPWPHTDTRSPVTSFTHLRHPHNKMNYSNFSTQNFSLIPQSGHRRKGQFMPHPTSLGAISALPPGLNISLKEHPTFIHFGGPLFNSTPNSFNHPPLSSVKTPPPINNIPKNYSGQQTYGNVSLLLEEGPQLVRTETIPNSRPPLQMLDHPTRHHHNGSRQQRTKLRTKKTDKWPLRLPSAHSNSVPRQSYTYPTSITPTPNESSQNQL